MYGRAIRFAVNKNVQQSTINGRAFLFSSVSTQTDYKGRNMVDDIRESASGMPPAPSSGNVKADDRVNVVKTSTTPLSSTFDRHDHPSNFDQSENRGHDPGSYVADTLKQGVVKAMETGLNIGEMAKQTLDGVWDTTKDTTHQVKKAVAGDDEKKYDVPPTDHFVDDLRKHAGGYDQREERTRKLYD